MRISSSNSSNSVATTKATAVPQSSTVVGFKQALSSAENVSAKSTPVDRKSSAKAGETPSDNSNKKADGENSSPTPSVPIQTDSIQVMAMLMPLPMVMPEVVSKPDESLNEKANVLRGANDSSSSNGTDIETTWPGTGQITNPDPSTASSKTGDLVPNTNVPAQAIQQGVKPQAAAPGVISADDAPKSAVVHPEPVKEEQTSKAGDLPKTPEQPASPDPQASLLASATHSPIPEQMPKVEAPNHGHANVSAIKPAAATTKAGNTPNANVAGKANAVDGPSSTAVQTGATNSGTGNAPGNSAGGDNAKSDFAAAVKNAEPPIVNQTRPQDDSSPVLQQIAATQNVSKPAEIDAKSGSGGTEAPPAPASTAPVYTAAAPASLSSAQLVQSMHGSEMRIGMHSEEFGAMSINATVNHQALAAQLSFDHADLSRAMAAHVPAIEEKLGAAYGMSARVEVRDHGASSADTSRQSGDQQRSQSRSSSNNSSSSSSVLQSAPLPAGVTPSSTTSNGNNTRLDVRI